MARKPGEAGLRAEWARCLEARAIAQKLLQEAKKEARAALEAFVDSRTNQGLEPGSREVVDRALIQAHGVEVAARARFRQAMDDETKAWDALGLPTARPLLVVGGED